MAKRIPQKTDPTDSRATGRTSQGPRSSKDGSSTKSASKKSVVKPRGIARIGDVARIGDILPHLMARYGFQRQIGSETLEKAWAESIGPQLAAVARPAAKRRGCLEIVVPHGAFAQELAFRESELLAALARLVPEEKIAKLKFVIR
ncbi:MAG TPA: hypothetical protein DEB39_10065 [Planctomycetaceae bacterium]|nr:hypothetical protein [Planctomycetaceae bacterium]